MIWWLVASMLVLAGALAAAAIGWRPVEEAGQSIDTARRPPQRDLPRAAADYMARAGINIPPERLWLPIAVAAPCAAAVLAVLPTGFGLIALLALAAALPMLLRVLAARLRRRTLLQLPSFLNQVIRRVAAGASVELAINDSIDSTGQPLQQILVRAGRRVRLGYELHDSLQREAAITGLPEFQMLATVLRLNEQFGGSIRGVLENIVDILQVRQQGERELRALTGETRITAFILAALPVAAAGYMLLLNANFFLEMWHDPLGHRLLLSAVAMEAAGVVVMWRMVHSI